MAECDDRCSCDVSWDRESHKTHTMTTSDKWMNCFNTLLLSEFVYMIHIVSLGAAPTTASAWIAAGSGTLYLIMPHTYDDVYLLTVSVRFDAEFAATVMERPPAPTAEPSHASCTCTDSSNNNMDTAVGSGTL